MKATALFTLLAILPQCAFAQQAKPPAKPFVLEAGDVKLDTLIDDAAKYLGCNILVSPQELQGNGASTVVKLQQRVETDTKGCREVLASLLSRSGFALTVLDENRGMYEVISMFGARGREIVMRAVMRTPEQVLEDANFRVPVSTVVKLEYINGTIATNALRPFFAQTGGNPSMSITLGTAGSNTSMVLSGMQDQVAQAVRMIRTCDVPQPPDPNNPEDIARRMDRLSQVEKRCENLEKVIDELKKQVAELKKGK